MFDSMIEPILLYGSELWGYENLKVIEQIQLKLIYFHLKSTCSKKRLCEASRELQAEIDQVLHVS
jgi:hypothetical protein